MNKKDIIVNEKAIGQRLDAFLLELYYQGRSRSYVQHAIKAGSILVNEKQVKTGYTLKLNDSIVMSKMEEKELEIKPVNMNLDIIYEDDDLLIINKPQGMVVHPASSYHKPTMVHGLLYQVENLSSINGIVRPGIVHRIDKDTSGLLVVAKNDVTHRALSKDLAEHKIEREYLALVYGSFTENEGCIDAPIQRHPKNRLKMTVISGGKFAKTNFKVIDRFEEYTLVSCQLQTGRTHQIRVHMSYIKHPIVGDPVYGPKEVIGSTGQFLHAKKLSFYHPIKKEHMTFSVDMPKEFTNMINALL